MFPYKRTVHVMETNKNSSYLSDQTWTSIQRPHVLSDLISFVPCKVT